MFQGILQLCNPPEFHKDSIDLESGGKGGRAEAQQRCRRIGDGKFGRKREIQQGSHSPAREPGHFSPTGRLGLNLCVPASLRSTAAAAAVRRRALPPVSKEPIRTWGVVWAPRLHRLSTARWMPLDLSLSGLLCQWLRQPLLFVPTFKRVCEARLPRLLQSALECCSSQEF